MGYHYQLWSRLSSCSDASRAALRNLSRNVFAFPSPAVETGCHCRPHLLLPSIRSTNYRFMVPASTLQSTLQKYCSGNGEKDLILVLPRTIPKTTAAISSPIDAKSGPARLLIGCPQRVPSAQRLEGYYVSGDGR